MEMNLIMIKLYEKDAYQTTFSGKVISCEKEKERWKVVMDQTCFYPEGGGQPADHGMLGEAVVLDCLLYTCRCV